MREIKYRAKIKGDAGVYHVWTIDWWAQRVFVERACGNEWVAMKKVEALLEFTGLKDKSGVEIYEADIVEWGGETCKWRFRVRWCEFAAGFEFDDRDINETEAPIQDGWNVGSESEVIGNIYENPELMETRERGQNDRTDKTV